MYFLVNASPPKLLDVATSNFADAKRVPSTEVQLGYELLRDLLPKGEFCRLCFSYSVSSIKFFETC